MCEFIQQIVAPMSHRGGGVNAPDDFKEDETSTTCKMAANQSSFEPQPELSREYTPPEEVKLLSTETLDRSSSELWPDKMPGVNSILFQFRTVHSYVACWKTITKQDIKETYKLSKL